ncbi:MAG: hypothetical protein LQ340_004237 [Diploschistes diacapsis]|nr:MAG: hypothetical protein LQ340_004237 [Diploschistes diacapsis]
MAYSVASIRGNAKKRNAELDELISNPPVYLKQNKAALINNTFQDLESEEELQNVEWHLTKRYNLLERVIRALKLHYSRFFALNMDYGHQHILDGLANQKSIVVRAIERVVRRLADVLFQQMKWFDWVREVQDEDERSRSKEKDRVKRETVLFQQHWRAMQARKRRQQEKEQHKRREAFLERAYKDNLVQREFETEDEEEWDPIDDVVEDDRGSFVDLLRYFLWQDESLQALQLEELPALDRPAIEVNVPSAYGTSLEAESCHPNTTSAIDHDNQPPEGVEQPKKGKKRKSKKAKVPQSAIEGTEAVQSQNSIATRQSEAAGYQTDKSNLETRAEMRQRLKEGSEIPSDFMVEAWIKARPTQMRIAPMGDEEVDRLIEDVVEIKKLLFCRLLLTQANLLPAAYRANSIQEFLKDESISTTDLRDLCLKMEKPSLDIIRDACADLVRGDEADNDPIESDDSLDKPLEKPARRFASLKEKGAVPDKWLSKRERRKRQMREAFRQDNQEDDLVGLLAKRNNKTNQELTLILVKLTTTANSLSRKSKSKYVVVPFGTTQAKRR